MKYIVQITQEDIDKGIKDSLWFCPAGRAIIRTMPKGFTYLWVQHWPPELWTLVRDFDNGRPVKPLSFTLEIEE